MKHLVRSLVFATFGLWFTSQLLPTMVVVGPWPTLFFAGLVLSLLLVIVGPILRILFLPINLITFGLLSWVINVILLYLLTVFVPPVQINPWAFPGVSLAGFVVPSMYFNYPSSLIVSSLVVTLVINLLHSVSEG